MPKKYKSDEVDETLKEYFEVRRFQDDFKEKEKLRKQAKLALLAFGYLVLVFFTFSSFGLGFLLPSTFDFSNKLSVETELKSLKTEIIKLKEENVDLKNSISEMSATSTTNAVIEARMANVEADQQKLYDSLILNPEDVVTARLLTEKLLLQDEKIISVNDSLRRIDDTLSKIMWSVIILPLLGILGLLFKDKLFGKNQYPDVG